MQTPCPHPVCLRAGLQRDVGEGAVAIVLEQVIEGLFARRKAFQPPAVDQEDVEPAVVVIVVEGDAAARGLEQVLVLVLAAKDGLGIESGFFGYVDEGDAEIAAGIRGWGFLSENRERADQGEHIGKREHERRAAERLEKLTARL